MPDAEQAKVEAAARDVQAAHPRLSGANCEHREKHRGPRERDQLAAIQMLDVHFPTTDGRTLLPPRHTQPRTDQRILLDRLGLELPPQPPPRISTGGKLTD